MAAHNTWLKKKAAPQPPESETNVIGELRELRRQLEGLQSYFALETDDDLLDAAIYLREALEARHRHLLRLAREGHMQARHLPVTVEKERWIN